MSITDTPPKPTRRLWRWLVFGALIIIVARVALRDRPYIDHRFEGDWDVVPVKWENGLSSVDLHFNADGSGYGNPPSYEVEHFTWWRTGDALMIYYGQETHQHRTWIDRLSLASSRVWHSTIGRSVSEGPELGYLTRGYTILKIDSDEIRLIALPGGDYLDHKIRFAEFTLRRRAR